MAVGNGQPFIVLEGIEEITKRDLAKHQELIVQTQAELSSYRMARSHEVKKKRHYRSLIGGGKYSDVALQQAIQGININIRHMSDKVKAAEEKLKHHQLIVETLSAQLKEQEQLLRMVRQTREIHGSGN